MALQAPTIVLFDMDGTTVRHINPLLLNILEKLDDFSYGIARRFSALINLKKPRPPMAGIVNRDRKPRLLVHHAMHKVRRKPVEQIVEPCPEIIPLLEVLSEAGVHLALVSNGLGKGYGHDILSKFDLEQYFEVSLFREDIQKSKPHPDPILRAINGLEKEPGSDDVIWYIGDRHKDVKAAIAARPHLPCKIQPLAYGLNAAIAILEHNIGPEHIIMNYEDFRPKLRELLAKKAKQNQSTNNRQTDDKVLTA
jgi:phosphoglycolate phosphatase